MSRYLKVFLLLCSCLTLAGGAQDLESLRGRVTRHTLKNGLRFLLLERHTSPTISFHVYFDVGAVDEQRGQTGVAHLYEHMAFKGTETIGTRDYAAEQAIMARIDEVVDQILLEHRQRKPDPAKITQLQQELQALQNEQKQHIVENELGQLLERNGAVGLNASTQMDATEYYVSLPANKLELWAAIESDRLAHPVLRQFYLERDVVLEERRLRFDTQPVGKLYENFLVHAFVAHPYGNHAGIGWESDLQNITRDTARAFFEKYYIPSNAIIAIVGDFQTAELIPMLDRYFAGLPAASPSPAVFTVEPPQDGERRIQVEFPSQPFLIMGYHRPDLSHPDDVVFDVIQNILSSGRTARLYRSMVEEKKVAVQAVASSSAFLTYGKYPTLFLFIGVPVAPNPASALEEAFEVEIERLKNEPVSERELQKTLNQLEAALIRALRSNAGLGQILAQREALTGGWESLLDLRDQYASVTPADITRVAREYFTNRNRTLAVLQAPASAEEGNEGATENRPEPEMTPEIRQAGIQLFSQIVEASGGQEAIEGVRNQVLEATVTLFAPNGEREGTVRSYLIYPDRMRAEVQMQMPAQFTQVLNGDQAWAITSGQTRDLPPEMISQLQKNLGAEPILLLKNGLKDDSQLRPLPAVELEGVQHPALELLVEDTGRYELIIDPESHRVAQVRYEAQSTAGQTALATEVYSDYRETEGVWIPYVVTTLQDGRKLAERAMIRVDLNAEIDPSLFEK